MKNVKLLFILLVAVSFGLMSCNDDDPGSTDPTPDRRAQLFVTNNSNGNIFVYDAANATSKSLVTASSAAEGIYFDAANDQVVQASRSGLQLNVYSDVSDRNDGEAVTPSGGSPANLQSPRELAVSGNTYVVSDNGSNTYFVYNRTGSGFELRNTFNIPFPVWGITFRGDDLYGVVDTENELAVFRNFLSNTTDGTLNPDKRITIEGIVRTHGLTYSGINDVMIMTDIGDAGNAQNDGGFHVISNFSSKFDAVTDGGVLPLSQQIRVAGSNTNLGNPIDVAYDAVDGQIYISEIGNGGGAALVFNNIGSGGNLAPALRLNIGSASSVYFSSDETDGMVGQGSANTRSELYVTDNAAGNLAVYDLIGGSSRTLSTTAGAAEGVYYSGVLDAAIQTSRSDNRIEYYSAISGAADGASISPDFTGNPVLTSPREVAVSGNTAVVSNNVTNQFFVYTFDGSSFTLQNTFTLPYNVWGITFMGDDLLSVVDGTSDLALFNDFLSSNTIDGAITPDKRITIGGIVRTHGIDYSAADNVLVMTDIGDAANATDDGGFQVINNFESTFNGVSDGGTLPLSSQVRVAGPATMMGNPIDVAYNHLTNTVYVTEVGNGLLLGYSNIGSGGNLAPNALNDNIPAASSIYFYSN